MWGEEIEAAPEEQDTVNLSISDEVRQLMEERIILTQDLRKVIAWAEKTGKKLVSKHTGHFLAHHTLAGVTFWVEYSPAEEGFVVHKAYSHRMYILEDLEQ